MAGDEQRIKRISKMLSVPHMVLATLFLITGIYLVFRSPSGTEMFVWVKVGLVIAAIPLGIIGMKNRNAGIGGLAFILLCLAMIIAFTKPQFLRSVSKSSKASLLPATPVEAGRDLFFSLNCILCHGKSGDAGFQGSKNLKATALDDKEIEERIRKGKGVMPPNPSLTDPEMKNLLAFIRSLKE